MFLLFFIFQKNVRKLKNVALLKNVKIKKSYDFEILVINSKNVHVLIWLLGFQVHFTIKIVQNCNKCRCFLTMIEYQNIKSTYVCIF